LAAGASAVAATAADIMAALSIRFIPVSFTFRSRKRERRFADRFSGCRLNAG
jgi:hypothetical protein